MQHRVNSSLDHVDNSSMTIMNIETGDPSIQTDIVVPNSSKVAQKELGRVSSMTATGNLLKKSPSKQSLQIFKTSSATQMLNNLSITNYKPALTQTRPSNNLRRDRPQTSLTHHSIKSRLTNKQNQSPSQKTALTLQTEDKIKKNLTKVQSLMSKMPPKPQRNRTDLSKNLSQNFTLFIPSQMDLRHLGATQAEIAAQ